MSQTLIVVNDLVENLATHYLPIFGIPNLQCFAGLSSLLLSAIGLRDRLLIIKRQGLSRYGYAH